MPAYNQTRAAAVASLLFPYNPYRLGSLRREAARPNLCILRPQVTNRQKVVSASGRSNCLSLITTRFWTPPGNRTTTSFAARLGRLCCDLPASLRPRLLPARPRTAGIGSAVACPPRKLPYLHAAGGVAVRRPCPAPPSRPVPAAGRCWPSPVVRESMKSLSSQPTDLSVGGRSGVSLQAKQAEQLFTAQLGRQVHRNVVNQSVE